MGNLPYFSVIVPTFNRVDLLPVTLKTVLGQTFPDFEVIVVDNGSTDGTDQVMQEFLSDPRIRYVRSAVNNERAWSRNRGLAEARGEFATFLDSDDFMYDACLQDAYEYSKAHPSCKFFHNLYELVDDDRRLVHRFRFPSLSNQFKALASGNFVSCIGGFLHRTVYPTVRFNEDPRMIGAEDYEIWFEVMSRHTLGRINRFNSGIREHRGRSVHQGVYLNLAYQEEQLARRITTTPHLEATFGRYVSRMRAGFALHRSTVSSQLGDPAGAIRHLFAAIVRDPSILATRRTVAVAYALLKNISR